MIVEIATKQDISEIVDTLTVQNRLLELDALIIRGEQVEMPIDHQFTDSLYMREVFVPAGTLFTTYTHKTTHPFMGIMGELLIWVEGKGWEHFKAPCRGITEAGTKRIVYTITDVVWVTYHANPDNIQDIDKLEEILLEKYDNPYLSLSELKALSK